MTNQVVGVMECRESALLFQTIWALRWGRHDLLFTLLVIFVRPLDDIA